MPSELKSPPVQDIYGEHAADIYDSPLSGEDLPSKIRTRQEPHFHHPFS